MSAITLDDYAAMTEEARMRFAVGALAAVAAVQIDVAAAPVEKPNGLQAELKRLRDENRIKHSQTLKLAEENARLKRSI